MPPPPMQAFSHTTTPSRSSMGQEVEMRRAKGWMMVEGWRVMRWVPVRRAFSERVAVGWIVVGGRGVVVVVVVVGGGRGLEDVVGWAVDVGAGCGGLGWVDIWRGCLVVKY